MLGSSRNRPSIFHKKSVNKSVGSEHIIEKSIEEPTLERTREVNHASAPKIDINSIGCQADEDDEWSPLKLRTSEIIENEIIENKKSQTVLNKYSDA